MATSRVGLKTVTNAKVSPKMVNIRDIAGECRRKRRRRTTTTTPTTKYLADKKISRLVCLLSYQVLATNARERVRVSIRATIFGL